MGTRHADTSIDSVTIITSPMRKMTKAKSVPELIDAETVECPACQGTGHCIQCHGEGRIPFQMAEEIEKRVKEREDEIRNEGRNEARRAIDSKDQAIKLLQENTTSLENKLKRTQSELDRVENDAKEAGRVEGRREVEREIETKERHMEKLQQDYESLEDRLAVKTTEERNSKKQLDDANKTVRKLTEQLKQSEVNKTPQEYGLLKEEVLVDFLTREFPDDQIIRNPGSHKGDVIQKVNHGGSVVGSILHERKETVSFNNTWIDKLDEDRLEREADSATLITKTMNKEDEPVRLYPNTAIMTPKKEIVKNIVGYMRWQIITNKSSIDDSRRIEMKTQVDKCVESYRRQWVAMLTTARSLKKALEEMAGATKDGMEGITEITKMLKLPSPKPLQELPFKPEL